jgi:hypothetical protein
MPGNCFFSTHFPPNDRQARQAAGHVGDCDLSGGKREADAVSRRIAKASVRTAWFSFPGRR